MLTDEQRREINAQAEAMRETGGRVAPEDLAEFPCRVEERMIPTSEGDCKVFVIEPEGDATADRPLIVDIHGGGFIGPRMQRDELFCRRLACRFGALVLDIDYKRAPEFPYPVAVHECQDVVAWALDLAKELRFDPEKVVLIGHSSGGNLVCGILLKNAQEQRFSPACAVLDYPPLDLVTDPADKPQSLCDMPYERARGYNAKYIAPDRASDPFVSPLFAPEELLGTFPETLVISAGEDRLAPEDEEFAMRLGRAGVTVTLRRFTDSVHGFTINRMCEWEEATSLIAEFIGRHLA